ncbi:MAG TPA: hypothetical protein VN937_28135 [Blastocatellia bacterium]|nr:hypothetical protein [Blastocatellia bacterium]
MRTASTLINPTPMSYGEPPKLPVSELDIADPDLLREAVFKVFSSLGNEDSAVMRKRLLSDLKRAGLRLRPTLLMLGASASTAEELTAPEIAALIRYVRLTEPGVMKAISGSLGELLGATEPIAQSSWAA